MVSPSYRKPNRLTGYDYNQAGYYFVTICTKNKVPYFGHITGGQMQYSWYGHIALQYWQQIPQPYQIVEIDEVVIMPNHIHGIIIIRPSGEATPPVGVEQCSTSTRTATEQCSVSTTTKHYGLLSKVIKSFKNVVTRQIRLQFEDNEFAWQRSFYDHIIRNENSLHDIRGYIKNNPRKWDLDKDNPASLYM